MIFVIFLVFVTAWNSQVGSNVARLGCSIFLGLSLISAMKILFLTQSYWPEPVGSSVVNTDMAEWLVENGHEVHVLTIRPNYPERRIYPEYEDGERDQEEKAGVVINRFPVAPPISGGALHRLMFELRVFLGLIKRFRKTEFDAVITVVPSVFCSLVPLVIRTGRRRHISIVHDLQSGLAGGLKIIRFGFLVSGLRWLERIALNGAARVVTLTDAMKEAIADIGVVTPIHVLPPQVNEKIIFPLPEMEPDEPIVLYSGNIGRKQGLETILNLAGRFQTEKEEGRFVIRGDGEYLPALKERAVEMKLNNITFEGFVATDELNEGLSSCAIHIVPQLPEGAESAIPSKIFSIMAAGKAFVCTAKTDSPLDNLSVESGAFECVEPGDLEMLAERVRYLLQDRAGREMLGRNGRKYIERHMTRDQIMNRFQQVILEVVGYEEGHIDE